MEISQLRQSLIRDHIFKIQRDLWGQPLWSALERDYPTPVPASAARQLSTVNRITGGGAAPWCHPHVASPGTALPPKPVGTPGSLEKSSGWDPPGVGLNSDPLHSGHRPRGYLRSFSPQGPDAVRSNRFCEPTEAETGEAVSPSIQTVLGFGRRC